MCVGYAPWVARQQRAAGDACVGSDQEVGQDLRPRTAGAAIVRVGMPRQKCGGRGDLLDLRNRRQSLVSEFRCARTSVRLCKDDSVEDERSSHGGLRQVCERPVQPALVLGEHVSRTLLSTIVPGRDLTVW